VTRRRDHPAGWTKREALPARTPAAVRAALAGADRTQFESEYQAAVSTAAEDYDLAPLQDVLDQWWHVAILITDPAAHQRMLDTADALRAGRPAASTPWAAVRTQLGV
jgi:hypothetical protein